MAQRLSEMGDIVVSILDTIPSPIFLVDDDVQILGYNLAASQPPGPRPGDGDSPPRRGDAALPARYRNHRWLWPVESLSRLPGDGIRFTNPCAADG